MCISNYTWWGRKKGRATFFRNESAFRFAGKHFTFRTLAAAAALNIFRNTERGGKRMKKTYIFFINQHMSQTHTRNFHSSVFLYSRSLWLDLLLCELYCSLTIVMCVFLLESSRMCTNNTRLFLLFFAAILLSFFNIKLLITEHVQE